MLKNWGIIRAEVLDPFARFKGKLSIVKHATERPTEEVISRAYSRLEERKYNLATNNCEHFATWCKTEEKVTPQVTSVKTCALKHVLWSLGPTVADLCRQFRDLITSLLKKGDIELGFKEFEPCEQKIMEIGSKIFGANITTLAGKDKGSVVKHLKSIVNQAENKTKNSLKISAALTALVELVFCSLDIHQMYKDFKQGLIRKLTFLKDALVRVTRCVGAVAGHFVGCKKIATDLSKLSVTCVVTAATTFSCS